MGASDSRNMYGTSVDRISPINLTGEELYRLTYRSQLTKDADIDDIIKKANAKNKTLDVGGALWCERKTGRIRQVLEGKHRAVNALLKVIAKDRRHHRFTIEREEFPLTRYYGSWGGMVFTESPDFDAAFEREVRKNLARYQFSFEVKGNTRQCVSTARQMVKEALNSYTALKIGGILMYHEHTNQYSVILEGEKDAIKAIMSKANTHKYTTSFQLESNENIKERAFAVFSKFSIARVSTATQKDFTVKLGAFECRATSTVESSSAIFFAVLRFYHPRIKRELATKLAEGHIDFEDEDEEKKEYEGPGLDELVAKMEVQLQIELSATKFKSSRSDSKFSISETPKRETSKHRTESNIQPNSPDSVLKWQESEEDVDPEAPKVKLQRKFHYFYNMPLGFRIQATTKQERAMCTTPYRFVAIPTTNTELLNSGIPAGSAILAINDINMTGEKVEIKKLVGAIRDGASKLPIKIHFGVKKLDETSCMVCS
ncbi:hypothetical protein AAMO2058_000911400 [Amorphochlora amoebiformis]